ncbi:MAG: hypothetical protein LUG98_01150 [Tannerellaceae bacterium]|nr:hypothetical protein [Tannerellaceae bacterium]
MEKKYKHDQPEGNRVEEPAIDYGVQRETEMTFSPPLTEEELKDSMTGEEFLDAVLSHIDKLFDKKK